MPHFRIEYSANLESKLNMPKFCRAMKQAIVEAELFEIGGIRVRAFKADHVAIADELPENAFIDCKFRVGKGRTVEQLKKAGEHIWVVAEKEAAQLLTTPHFMLSFSIGEINDALSWKKNSIHARLRNK